MMFAGTYRSEFYRAIRNLLHDEVRTPRPQDIEQRWTRLIENQAAYRQSLDDETGSLATSMGGALT